MKTLKILIVFISVIAICSCTFFSPKPSSANSDIVFQEGEINFTKTQKDFIQESIFNSEEEIRELLPNLPDSIQVIIEHVDWNLNAVGGVTGRAEKNDPPLVMIQISNTYQGGVIDSIQAGLKATIFHEFHHLFRGWAIDLMLGRRCSGLASYWLGSVGDSCGPVNHDLEQGDAGWPG